MDHLQITQVLVVRGRGDFSGGVLSPVGVIPTWETTLSSVQLSLFDWPPLLWEECDACDPHCLSFCLLLSWERPPSLSHTRLFTLVAVVTISYILLGCHILLSATKRQAVRNETRDERHTRTHTHRFSGPLSVHIDSLSWVKRMRKVKQSRSLLSFPRHCTDTLPRMLLPRCYWRPYSNLIQLSVWR